MDPKGVSVTLEDRFLRRPGCEGAFGIVDSLLVASSAFCPSVSSTDAASGVRFRFLDRDDDESMIVEPKQISTV